jgi:hypothetical protein
VALHPVDPQLARTSNFLRNSQVEGNKPEKEKILVAI